MTDGTKPENVASTRAESKASTALDIAALLALGTALLYLLAWIYWTTVLRYLGLPASLADLTVENVISGTYPAIAVVWGAVLLLRGTLNTSRLEEITLGLDALLLIALTVCGWVVLMSDFPVWLNWTLLGLAIVSAILINRLVPARPIDVGKHMRLELRSERLVAAYFVLATIGLGFSAAAHLYAKSLAEGNGKGGLSVLVKGNERLPDHVVLVGRFHGNYVFVEPHDPNPRPSAIVIPEGEVLRIASHRD